MSSNRVGALIYFSLFQFSIFVQGKNVSMPAKSDKIRGNKRQVTTAKTSDVSERIQKSIVEKFTDEQLSEFRDLFNMFDKENQGSFS